MNTEHKTIISVHGYHGDMRQIIDLIPVFEHHKLPIVIMTPEDSRIEHMGPHICRWAGKRAYVGQDSWDRQWLQLNLLLGYEFDWILMNDSDSFILPAKLPEYLFEDEDTVFSNEVTDFRVPGTTSHGVDWPHDYHSGYPLIAMQPPYFCSRIALERLLAASQGMTACPITPFIDWWWVPACTKAGLTHKPFRNGASCETVTPNGVAVMSECIVKRGAEMIHSVKSAYVMRKLLSLYQNL